jgi:hypothetical protein
VLHRGHSGCILVESVEKPTDNRSASLLCCRLADFPKTSPALPPAHFPIPPPASGAAATSTEVPVPVLDPNRPTRGTTKGMGGWCYDVESHAVEITHRRSGFVWTKKWAFNWSTAESVAIRIRGLKVTRFTLNELYRAERCRDLAEEYRLVAAMCASTEARDHYSRMSEHYRTLAEAEESEVETSSAFEP